MTEATGAPGNTNPRRFSCFSADDPDAPLPPAFYQRPAAEVARDLLGRVIVSDVDGLRSTGRIVETEAYVGPHDDASHAAERVGRTPRNESMFGRPGLAYVYRSYGIHWCLNAVTDEPGFPAAVLIRAAEPLAGIETITGRRSNRPFRDLMRGPGNVCSALGITGALDGHDLGVPPLTILPGQPPSDDEVGCGPRIGITRAADLPLRFYMAGNRFVSRKA